MLRLHGFLHDRDQALRQFIQIRLVAHSGGEGGERLGRVVFLAVETPVNPVLHPAAEGRKQRGDGERG